VTESILSYWNLGSYQNKFITKWLSSQIHGKNSFSQANGFLTTQEIPLVFWNPKVYFRVQQIQPLVSVPREINPVHDLQLSFFMINFNIILPTTSMPSSSSCFPTKILYALLLSSLHCTFPDHIIQDTNSYYKGIQSALLHPDTYLTLRYIRDLYSIENFLSSVGMYSGSMNGWVPCCNVHSSSLRVW